jgi:hypothetical protein
MNRKQTDPIDKAIDVGIWIAVVSFCSFFVCITWEVEAER